MIFLTYECHQWVSQHPMLVSLLCVPMLEL